MILYDRDNIDQCIWPENERYKEYYINLIKNPIKNYLSNADTSYAIIKEQDVILPITINDKQYESTYICSPYNAFITYGKDELHKLNNNLLEWFYRFLADLAGIILKWGKINKVVQVNNFLVSTNLYDNSKLPNIKGVTDFLIKRFHGHTIIFRSLTVSLNLDLINQLKSADYKLLPSRNIYIINYTDPKVQNKTDLKNDFNLLSKTSYKVISNEEINHDDYERIAELYQSLYISKYSKHNPQFTKEYFKLAHKSCFLKFYGLRNQDDLLEGIIGYAKINNIITSPIMGYDTSILHKESLYFMLSSLMAKDAIAEGYILNASAGADTYKKLRGGLKELEYSAIYFKHLSWYRRLFWRLLIKLAEKIIGKA